MRVFYGFDDLPRFRRPVVTMGSYDGVHAGHRELLELTKKIASDRDGESVVLTFSPHPREVLGSGEGVGLLNSPEEKVSILESTGIDNLIIIPFTKEFSKISSRDFVKDYLVGKINVDTLIVGYNHHFGHNKEGSPGSLEHLRAKFGFDIFMVPQRSVNDDKVSSTIIRNLIAAGNIAKANAALGYNYFFTARISRQGDKTFLVINHKNKLLPPAGDYLVEISCGDKLQKARLVIASDGSITVDNTLGLADGEKIIVVFL